MRLTLATPLYPPDIGGPATDVASLSKRLPAHDIEVVVCSFGTCRHLPRGIRHVVYAYRLFRAARGTEGIVAFDTFSVGLPAVLVARLLRVPLIVRVPGDYAWEQGMQRFGVTDSLETFQEKRYGFFVELLRKAQRFVVQQAALVLVPSNFFKRIASSWGISEKRLVRIYLGLDMLENIELPTDIPEGNILFSVGRFVPWKGFSLLIGLMPTLPGWHLVIAGDGPLRSALQEQVRALGVQNKVTFTGSIPHAQVLGWCQKANAFALNTSFESFSYQILEAMMSGIPIVTTTAGSLPELIASGEEGVLCSTNDADAFRSAIQSVASEPELWHARSLAAKRKATQFSNEVSAKAFADALKKICA